MSKIKVYKIMQKDTNTEEISELFSSRNLKEEKDTLAEIETENFSELNMLLRTNLFLNAKRILGREVYLEKKTY